MQTSQFVYSKIPFVRIVIPFILGIYLFNNFPALHFWASFSIVLTLFLFLVVFQLIPHLRSSYRLSFLWGIFLYSALISAGYSLCMMKSTNAGIELSSNNGFILGDISEQPTEKEKSIKTVVDIKAIRSNNEWVSSEGRVILYFLKDNRSRQLKHGDRIIFEPAISGIKNAGNPNEFDYKQYLAFHLISYQGYLKSDKWKLLESKKHAGIFAIADQVREKLIMILKKYGLRNENFAVASAISIGYKNELDEEIKKSYSSTGATHILSVSGLHVGIVYLVFNFLLFFLKRKTFFRILKAVLILLLLWGYALLTGLSPSVLRAATMFSFVVIGNAINRHTNIYNSLAASAMVLLVINPFILFEIGFQLSYLAVIGIVFFQPMIYRILYIKNKVLDKLWILISVSIAAQLITMPLSLFYFHQFPNYFILSGIIVVPMATIIIYLVILLFLISPWEWASSLVGKGLDFLVGIMNKSIKIIEELPGALASDIPFNKVQLILLYTLLIFISIYILKKKMVYLRLILICIIGILITGLITKQRTLVQRKFFVYNINGISALNFIDGSNNVLFSDIETQKNKNLKLLKGNWLSLGVESERIVPFSQLKEQFLFTNLLKVDNKNLFFKNNFINFYGCRILRLNEAIKLKENINTQPIKVDYLVISNNTPVDISTILKVVRPELIILDSSNSRWKTDKWIALAKEKNIKVFAVIDEGAFTIDI